MDQGIWSWQLREWVLLQMLGKSLRVWSGTFGLVCLFVIKNGKVSKLPTSKNPPEMMHIYIWILLWKCLAFGPLVPQFCERSNLQMFPMFDKDTCPDSILSGQKLWAPCSRHRGARLASRIHDRARHKSLQDVRYIPRYLKRNTVPFVHWGYSSTYHEFINCIDTRHDQYQQTDWNLACFMLACAFADVCISLFIHLLGICYFLITFMSSYRQFNMALYWHVFTTFIYIYIW